MAYIGNTPALQYITHAKQTFTADSSTVAFTLSNAVANENELEVFVNNVRQEPGSGKAYTASGTTLTMSEAPTTGDDFYCIYQGKATQTVTPGNGTVLNDHLASGAFSNITGVGTLSAATISGDLTVDTNTLKVDSTNNRVGIGESNPGYTLVVDGGANTTIRVQNDTPYYGDFQATTSGIQIRTIGSYPLIFNTNQTERMRITDAGRIGIGSSSPGTNDAVLIENGQSYLTIKDAQQMGIQLHGDDTNVIYSYDKTAASLTGGITFGHADGQTEFKTGGSSTRMTIKPDGNVGIGLTAPDSKLHVVNTGGQAAKIHSDTNNSGDLGMSILAGLDTASSSGDCKWVRLADGNDSGKAYIQFKSSSPNAEFAAISDERLKTNIQDTDVVGLDVINNLRLVKFDWNDTATQNAGWSMTGHQKLGFVAQEVEQILPEFISEDTNGFKIMGDSGFVPYLIKAMQEQQTKIQELEARITQLENA